MNTTRSISILAVLCAISALADQTIPDNYDTTSSSKTLTVAPGDVDTYTGLFSGSKNLFLSAGSEGTVIGGGTAVLTNPGNTFSGSFILGLDKSAVNPNGVFRFDSAGASGTARCYTNGGSKEESIRQYQFNAEGATFQNNLEMGGSGTVGYNYAPFKFLKSCTLAGKITGGSKTISIIDDATERPTVNFLGDMSMSSSSFEFVPSGIFKIYGKMTIPQNQFLLLSNTNALGTVELYNYSNSIDIVRTGYTNLKLMSPNVLTNATLQFNTEKGFTGEGIADVYLYANQHIKAFTRATGWWQTGDAGVIRAGEGILPILTFDGHETDSDLPKNHCRFAFDGPISLVKVGSGSQNFSYRASTMTGAIVVSNGTFKISSIATFPDVSAVKVEGGLLDMSVSTNTGCFASTQRLTVADDAQLLIGRRAATPFSNLQSVVLGSTGKIESSNVNGAFSLTIETENLEIGGKTLLKGLYTSTTHPGNIGEGITIKCNKKGGLMMILR